MKASVTLIFAAAGLITATSVSYDYGYDNATRSLDVVSCSDGPNGLITRYGWQTQGDVAGFPYLGGADAIGGWNSPECGTCFAVTYAGTTVHILAIDRAAAGLNIGEAAMNRLTHNQAEPLGRVDANVTQVDGSHCRLPPA